MSNSNNKSKKRYNQESIDTASRMSENITLSPSPSKKNTPSPSKKNNKNYENLLNKLGRAGINGTPSPVKKPTRSTSSGSIPPKLGSSFFKSESNTSEENISIAQTKSKSKSNSESGKNISFTSTKKTQVTAKNISFNSTKATTPKSSKKKTVSRASTQASSKSKPRTKRVEKLNKEINNLKKGQKTQAMPRSVYIREIKRLQAEIAKLEENKQSANSNTGSNSKTGSNSNTGSSLRSYTSQEASFQKGRNAQKSFSPMSINNKSKSSPYSMMSINGSMAGSTRSTPSGTVRRSLLGNMSRVLNLSANQESREATTSKKKSKKKSKKRSDK